MKYVVAVKKSTIFSSSAVLPLNPIRKIKIVVKHFRNSKKKSNDKHIQVFYIHANYSNEMTLVMLRS